MAYHVYTTTALVCGTFDRNTADRSYLLFTREAGMIFALARSSREERSRQRYALQDFSLVRVSLVKGKQDWRIGSIEALGNYYHEAIDREVRGSVTRLIRLIRRLVRGESVDPQLFDMTLRSLEMLRSKVRHRSFLELTLELRLLVLLGYVDAAHMPFSVGSTTSEEIDGLYSEELWQRLLALHTHALSVSHL